MKILISNDDGYQAPGIVALYEALKDLADVEVVAPEHNNSAKSNALTLHSPLYVHTSHNGFRYVNGTPADCVHIALNGLLDFTPDIIVSGINAGANLGDDVIYSGTVAAALEGRFLGRPAIAVSLVAEQPKTLGIDAYRPAAARVGELLRRWQRLALPPRTLLNITVPAGPLESHRGFRVTRLGHRGPSQDVLRLKDPRGNEVFWIGPAGREQDSGPGTDFHAVRSGHISITPIQVDLTRYQALEKVASWVGGLSAALDQPA